MTAEDQRKANSLAKKRRIEKAEASRKSSPWLTAEEAAARAKVSISTIHRWVAGGKLPAHRILSTDRRNGITRFKISDLDALFEGSISQPNQAASIATS